MKKQVIPAFTLIECLIGLMILSSLLLTFNLLIQQTIQVSEFLQRKDQKEWLIFLAQLEEELKSSHNVSVKNQQLHYTIEDKQYIIERYQAMIRKRRTSDIKGSGIPQVEGQLRGELSMNWFSVLWKKFIGGVLSVGAGLFLGREGPSIQLGASIGQGAGQLFRSPSSEEKILISSGASSGLAAAFNAPIAGLLFVLEEIHHSFSPLVWLTSFASAITANFVSLYFFGLRPVLYLGDLPSLPLKYYGSLVILGVLLGILGFIYQKVLLALPKFYNRLPLPAYFHGFVPFLLILPIGYLWPSTLGGGNQIVLAFGHASLPIIMIIGLFVLRFVFSMISYGGGLPGGIFLPILTLGALIGSFYGNIMVDFGMDPIYIKDFVVIAMAGYFTAIGKAPLTAIILVTEMVGSLNHLMPLGLDRKSVV